MPMMHRNTDTSASCKDIVYHKIVNFNTVYKTKMDSPPAKSQMFTINIQTTNAATNAPKPSRSPHLLKCLP